MANKIETSSKNIKPRKNLNHNICMLLSMKEVQELPTFLSADLFSTFSHFPLKVYQSKLQVRISNWIHRWLFSAFESFWLLLFFLLLWLLCPFSLFFWKSSKDLASTSKYVFGGVLCIAYIGYSTNTFSISSAYMNKIMECTLSLSEWI